MSRISHKYKFIFFAYPKTGSTSIRNMLDPYSDIIAGKYSDRTDDNPFYSHITAAETKQIFENRGWDYDSYFKFVVVRNPWSRLVSLYNMTACKIMTFTDWILLIRDRRVCEQVLIKNSQSVQITDHNLIRNPEQKWKTNGMLKLLQFAGDGKKLLVDRVLKLENITTELPAVLEHLGLPDVPKTIPTLNVSRYHLPSFGQDYRKYYSDPTSKKKAKEIYGWEMKEYKYSFF